VFLLFLCGLVDLNLQLFKTFQLIESARLNDFALAKHEDDVGVNDGLDAVCDGQGRNPLRDLVEGFLYEFLVAAVQGGCGFIQNEDLWFSEDGTCDGYALFLSS
jgi:hypothetical protein